jgi:hypothetical protein
MKQKSGPGKAPAEQVLKDIRRQTRRHFSAEEKIRIVLEGLRGEENISELCRREGIAASIAWQETRPVPRLSARSTLSNWRVRTCGGINRKPKKPARWAATASPFRHRPQ